MQQLPTDPVILLSYINTQLRDNFPSLDELCESLCISRSALCEKLAAIDYCYDRQTNRFI